MERENQEAPGGRPSGKLSSGDLISHYKILSHIGTGGMGEIFLAEDLKLSRKVALKFLPEDCCPDENKKARFLREAQAAAKLSHPNIVTIYEVNEYKGRPFIAMEHLEGLTLDEYAKEKKPNLDETIGLAIQVCEGLQDAHSQGIVHRDIKPGNILVDRKGRAKILDFGLATVKGTEKVTKAGSTLGTVSYMSPEQTRGEEMDNRSDIFSFGVMLYEMIAGQLPFKGEHEPAIVYSIVYEEPEPLARFRSGVRDDLQRMMTKTLAKEKNHRYQHADDLAADLRNLQKGLENEKDTVRDTSRVKPRPRIAVLYLQNFSENKEDEYFAAGMTEDIITQLSKIGQLLVTSRSNVEQFKGKSVSLKEVAEKSRVEYVMEGSVRKYGQKVRINCQLIKADDGFHVWAESFDRQMEDIFDIQAEVAKSVAQALRVVLVPAELEKIEKKPTENVQAYNYYLQGREYYLKGFSTKEGLYLAIKTLEKAIKADPGFALAYVALMHCYTSYVMFQVELKRSWLEKSEEAGLKALALDPNLPEAYSGLARLYWTIGRSDRMIQKAEEAVIADPNHPLSWRMLGFWSGCIGLYSKAEKALMKALELNPSIPALFGDLIALYSRWGRDGRVAEYFDRGLKILPDDWWTYFRMIDYYFSRGRLDEAEILAHKALDINPRNVLPYWYLMTISIISDDAESAQLHLETLRSFTPNLDLFTQEAYIELMKGEKGRAKKYLEACIKYNQPLVREFEGFRDEYYFRTQIAFAYALMEEPDKALEEVEVVKRELGDALLRVEWTVDRDIIQLLSFIYALTVRKEEAVSILEFQVKNHIVTPAHIRLWPFYKNLTGYPPYEKLMSQE